MSHHHVDPALLLLHPANLTKVMFPLQDQLVMVTFHLHGLLNEGLYLHLDQLGSSIPTHDLRQTKIGIFLRLEWPILEIMLKQ
jgi:hypothetical protein